jgi:hypothetical protein
MRSAVVAAAALAALSLAGCDKATPPGGAKSQAQASPTTTVTAPATGAPSSPGAAKSYDCTTLLTNAEAMTATGLDFKLADAKNGASKPWAGYTDCGYFAPDGTYLQATVWTGQAYEQGFLPQVQAARAGSAEPVTGIGDEAGWNAENSVLGVRVGGTGVTIAFAFAESRGAAQLKDWARKVATVVINRL